MSDEGIWLVSRLALMAALIVVTAAMRTMIGRGKRRGRIMTAGTIGGLALGLLIATPLSRWFGADVSAIVSGVGVIAGWGIAWQFARQIPREAH